MKTILDFESQDGLEEKIKKKQHYTEYIIKKKPHTPKGSSKGAETAMMECEN